MNLSVAKERLAAVVKPDSITASQGDFLTTHVAIKKLVLLNKFEFVPHLRNTLLKMKYIKSLSLIQLINISLLLCMAKAEQENRI